MTDGTTTGTWLTRRRFLQALSASGAAALLAACGAPAAAPAPTTAPAPTAAAQPTSAPVATTRLVKHSLGETQVPLDPQRIIVIDYNSVEELASLGIKPVGTMYEPPPWLLSSLEGVEIVGTDDQPNFEKMLLLKPDLIIAWSAMMGDAKYENLTNIAPTVILDKTSFAEWKQSFRFLAGALGKEAMAEQLIGQYEARAAKLRAAIGEEATRKLKVSFFRDWGGDGKTLRVAAINSFSGSVLADIGFDRPDAVKGTDKEEIDVNMEQLALADGDALFVGTWQDSADSVGAIDKLKTNPLWAKLKAVAAGKVFDVDNNHWLQGSTLNANVILDDIEKALAPR